MSRRIFAVLLCCLLPGAVWAAQSLAAGVVLQSQSARLNTTDATMGTTLYDGDRLETQSKGALTVRSSANQILLTLAADSLLWMNHENSVLTPKLDRGTVIFRAEMGEGIEIHADDVRVRPHAGVLTVGEVTIKECEILVTARTQSLDVTAGKETKLLEEGKTFKVTRLGTCGGPMNQTPRAALNGRFWILPASMVPPLIIPPILESLESPDRP